jgi:hypothetical protein
MPLKQLKLHETILVNDLAGGWNHKRWLLKWVQDLQKGLIDQKETFQKLVAKL